MVLSLKAKKMKTRVEIRVFAVEQAVRILGAGTPQRDVVEKAKEIELYITEGIELPDVDTFSPADALTAAVGALTAGNSNV